MALTLFLLFMALAVAGRVILQYRIAGDHGIRPVRLDSPWQSKLSSLMLIVAFSAIFVLVVLNALDPPGVSEAVGQLWFIAGVGFAMAGMGLTMLAQYQMGASWRIGVDEREQTGLITHGLYASVRNPIYSGVLLFCMGLLCLVPNLYMAACVCLGYLGIELHVRFVEEPYLARVHGAAFASYTQKTGRYLPRFWPDAGGIKAK